APTTQPRGPSNSSTDRRVSQMVKKGGRNLLLYAIVLGLMAAGGAAWYISTAEAAANPTESVVVAKRTIPARTVLTEDLLVMQKVQPKNADGMLSTSARPQAKPIANTITLALTPEESQKLVLLENHASCNLRLALRAAGDQAKVSDAVVEFNPTASMAPIIGQ